MRTQIIEKNIYRFDELTDEQKEKALEKWSDGETYFWGDDAIKSLEGFINHFNCKLSNYSIDWFEGYRNEIKIDIPDYMNEISVKELKEYIKSMGSYNKKTLQGLGDCKFTGYCADEDACDGARKSFFSGVRDLREILMAGFNSWYKACNQDAKYQFSIEGFAEHCEANGYEFDENGNIA
jgi:hypothetical protein